MDRLLVSYENIRLLGLVFKIIVYTYTQAKSLETILKNWQFLELLKYSEQCVFFYFNSLNIIIIIGFKEKC